MCPHDLSTIRLQPFAMFRFPKPELSKIPDPRTSAVGFLYPHRNSICENFFSSKIRLNKFFPKRFHQKIFPGLLQKIFPAHATKPRFAIFQKRRIAPFVRFLHPILTSCSRPSKTGTEKQPFFSFRHSPANSSRLIVRPKDPSVHFFKEPSVPTVKRGATTSLGCTTPRNCPGTRVCHVG